MKVTTQWLKDYVDFDWSPEDLAHRLTMVGLEVEGIESRGEEIAGVIVGEVRECGPHPNADKLSLCKVFDGSEEFDVVCGAPNVRKGLRIAFARIGTKLPGDFKIKKAKIRGVESQGMICSERELELSDEHTGILELPDDAPIGERLVDVLGLGDTVLEIGLTPNRGDCLGVIGVAREVAALAGTKLRLPSPDPRHGLDRAADAVEGGGSVEGRVRVDIEDPKGCGRYIARMIDDVTVQPSPPWMQRRLEAVGIRAISNIVDVTNYVMMELGQPLHAFDMRNVGGERIIVRRAKSGEVITTLDDVERKLTPEDLVIADADRPVALAGVMGGEGSGVTDDTHTVLLESAWFEPGTIRRTSRRHGLSSDSSYRFERGVDRDVAELASQRAAALIAETGGGRVAPGRVEAGKGAEPWRIIVDLGRVNALLGTRLDAERAAALLQPLSMQVTTKNQNQVSVEVPTWRTDVTRMVDVAEELARRVGYDDIQEVIPTQPLAVESFNAVDAALDRCRDILAGLGFHETIHLSFVSPQERVLLGVGDNGDWGRPVRLKNPLSDEEGELRSVLLPSLLRNLARNRAHRNDDVRIFELRHVFRDAGGERPREPHHLSALLSGRRSPRIWEGEPPTIDFFDAKGAVEVLLDELGHRARFDAEGTPGFLVPGAGASIRIGDKTVGWVGEIDPDVLFAFDLEDVEACALEIDLDTLFGLRVSPVEYNDIPRFPAAVRDLAVVVDESVHAGEIAEVAVRTNRKLIESVDIFDIYRGPQLGDGKKSVALTVTYRDPAKTLKDKEVLKAHDAVTRALEEKLGAKLRA